MTDRELLELAAKAAGQRGVYVENHYVIDEIGVHYLTGILGSKNDEFVWNPLDDDGDALRLAVSLGFNVDVYRKHALQNNPSVVVRGYESRRVIATELAEDNGASLELSTRRAITRAAAEIQLAKDRNNG